MAVLRAKAKTSRILATLERLIQRVDWYCNETKSVQGRVLPAAMIMRTETYGCEGRRYPKDGWFIGKMIEDCDNCRRDVGFGDGGNGLLS